MTATPPPSPAPATLTPRRVDVAEVDTGLDRIAFHLDGVPRAVSLAEASRALAVCAAALCEDARDARGPDLSPALEVGETAFHRLLTATSDAGLVDLILGAKLLAATATEIADLAVAHATYARELALVVEMGGEPTLLSPEPEADEPEGNHG